MHPKDIYKGYKVARKSLRHTVLKCSMKMYLKVIGCSYYTCLPHTAPAAQSARKTAAPGTGTGAPQMDQRLLTNTWPKQCTIISIQANTNKN